MRSMLLALSESKSKRQRAIIKVVMLQSVVVMYTKARIRMIVYFRMVK